MLIRPRLNDQPEIYLSTDVEADGPIPGPHSMLSFASAAYLPDKTLVRTYSANLETLPGSNVEGQPYHVRDPPLQVAYLSPARASNY